MTEQKHTTEPWSGEVKLCHAELRKFGITVVTPHYFDEEAKANARRVVTCVNACAGLDTTLLESSGDIASAAKEQAKHIAMIEHQRDAIQSSLNDERKAWSEARTQLLQMHDSEQKKRIALQQQRDQLRAALELIMPWVVTQEVACNGIKCREAVCMSCSSDSESSA